MRILIVEDDKNLALTLKEVVESKGFETTVCFNFRQALNEIEKAFDLYLLDVRLPDGNGLDLCERIRETSEDPILFISSDTSETSILKSYSLQADDYIEKPVRLNILLAKIESILHRSGKYKEIYQIGSATLNLKEHLLTIQQNIYELSTVELSILEGMFKAYPDFITRENSCRLIFSHTSHYPSLSTLSVRISELKKKLDHDAYHIESFRTLGFRWKQ